MFEFPFFHIVFLKLLSILFEIFDNLFCVGAGTHPGAGMPGVLSSAKVLDKIF